MLKLQLHIVFGLWSILLLGLAPGASAEEIDELFCRNGGFPIENSDFGVATITGKGRAYLKTDMHGCPNDSPQCSSPYFVTPGTRVVTGRKHDKYICVYHSTSGGDYAGWLAEDRLRSEPVDKEPSVSSWLGGWSDYSNPRVVFAADGGTVAVRGVAFWPAEEVDEESPPYTRNEAGIGGPVSITGNRALEPDCNVSFILLGDFLVGADPDGKCGGMNVRFSGVYTRDPHVVIPDTDH